MKITEKEVNAITGEETITERDATAAEIAERAKIIAKTEADLAQAEADAIAKAALFAKLGITAHEAALLLS